MNLTEVTINLTSKDYDYLMHVLQFAQANFPKSEGLAIQDLRVAIISGKQSKE